MNKVIENQHGYLMWKHWLRGDFMLQLEEHTTEMVSRGYRLVVNPPEDLLEDLSYAFSGHDLKLIDKK